MAQPLMYEEEMFVLLAPGTEEEILSAGELLQRLMTLLADRQDDLPRELQRLPDLTAQAQHLRDTACELELSPGRLLQWYAIRLEK